jgi:hypothetical protein
LLCDHPGPRAMPLHSEISCIAVPEYRRRKLACDWCLGEQEWMRPAPPQERQKIQRDFLKQWRGIGGVLNLRPFEEWIESRPHRKLLQGS